MKIDVLTLFPKMFDGILTESMLKRAQDKGLVRIDVHNLRDWTHDRHRKVDDRPYGGGPGMVMKPEPIFEAVDFLIRQTTEEKLQTRRIILLTPQGKRLNQEIVEELSKSGHLILICGHYEGVDERVREALITDEISIGDYILTGGELPAMVLIDSIMRLLPGVLGDSESIRSESFSHNLLKYPQYTRPRIYRGMKVPDTLLSGDHRVIEEWRKKEALARTRKRRQDLLNRREQ